MFNAVYPGYYECVDPDPYLYYAGYFSPAQYNNHMMDNSVYGTDEFRMYTYKVRRCTRMRSHDWTQCPYAHRGEKAQRRDPRRYHYAAIVCPAYRMTGRCHRGDLCELSHGVFEYWLHPDKYRTRACNAGLCCLRIVCFFAHTPDQLRSEPVWLPRYPQCPYALYDYEYPQPQYDYRAVAPKTSNAIGGRTSAAAPTAKEYETMLNNKRIMDESVTKVEKFLNSLRGLKLSGDWKEYEGGENIWKISEEEASIPALPEDLDWEWVTEMMQ